MVIHTYYCIVFQLIGTIHCREVQELSMKHILVLGLQQKDSNLTGVARVLLQPMSCVHVTMTCGLRMSILVGREVLTTQGCLKKLLKTRSIDSYGHQKGMFFNLNSASYILQPLNFHCYKQAAAIKLICDQAVPLGFKDWTLNLKF